MRICIYSIINLDSRICIFFYIRSSSEGIVLADFIFKYINYKMLVVLFYIVV